MPDARARDLAAEYARECLRYKFVTLRFDHAQYAEIVQRAEREQMPVREMIRTLIEWGLEVELPPSSSYRIEI